MSMSQEEIEALMNGLELPDEKNDAVAEEEIEEEAIDESDSQTMTEDDIAKLLSQTDDEEESDSIISTNTDIKENISEVLSEIDNMEEDDIINEDNDEDYILDESDNNILDEVDLDFDEKAKNWTEKKISKGEFPFPAEPSTKVVSQLNEVANDSEEKAGQIFDVLSYILDDNAVIQKSNKKIIGFVDKEIELLNALSAKFPNIKVFDERLQEAQLIKETTSDIANRISAEDMKLFEAMELMQFNDINRQKIERVMSVIRKLTTYLNNLFEEDEDYEEIAIAKHIHGDSNADLVGAEDLDALIAEFSK